MSSENFPSSGGGGKEGFSIARLVIFLLAVGVLGYIAYRSFYADGAGGGGGYTNVPEEVQLKYVPSDFNAEIDEEAALPILSNPYRYSREFDQLVYDFNLSMLNHVASRMNLSDSLKVMVRGEYDQHHPYIRRLMFNDFVALKDTSSVMYETWYQSESTGAVDILNEVASKYTCFLVNQIFSTLLKTDEGKIYVKGAQVDTPCGVALTEALAPTIARLKQRAAIEDFNQSKGMINQRVERTVAELGTMEIRDRKGIGTSKQTKVLGFDVSSTEMEMSAISILKVGFKLDRFFNIDLNGKSGIVTVTLPEPEILSHEVFPKIDKLDVGWMREIDQEDFNKNMNLLRREFRQDALESDVMEKAKQKAAELMDTMLSPVVKSMDSRFQIRVQFKDTGPKLPEEKETAPFG